MKAPFERYARLGLVHNMAYPVAGGDGPILETLGRVLRDPDFEVVEIAWMRDPEVRREAARMLAASGVHAMYGAHPRILSQQRDLNALDDVVRARAVREIHEALDEALELGCREVCVLSGPYPGATLEAAALDALVASLVELGTRAERDGLALVLEVFDRDVDKRCLVGPAVVARSVAERVRERCPRFGLVVDLSHTPLLHETPRQALAPVAEHLRHVHIGNCVLDADHAAYGDTHPRLGYPGGASGAEQLAEFLSELFAIGYLDASGARRATVSFEVKPIGSEDPDLVVAASKRVLRDAWWRLTEPTPGGQP